MKYFVYLSLGFLALCARSSRAQGSINPPFPTIVSSYANYLNGENNYLYGLIEEKQPWNLDFGQYWRMQYTLKNGNDSQNLIATAIGDSIVNEKTYTMIRIEKNDTLLYRQEDDKVFLLDESAKEYKILDYGLSAGDFFTDIDGSEYIITDTSSWYDNCMLNIFHAEETGRKPRVIKLTSIDNSMEDVWIEGIGSVHWGIVPLSVAKNLNLFPNPPMEANVLYATGPNMEVLFNCKKEKYAFAYFQGGSDKRGKAHMDYMFTTDTLCISGYCELNCAYRIGIIELHVEGESISVSISQSYSIFNEDIATCVGYYPFDVRIPGFNAGTYQIYHADDAPITLSCQGTVGIHPSRPTHGGQATSNIYDVAGRRITQSTKGVYIQGGRKIVR